MMLGVEVTDLTLIILPLIISTAKCYNSVLSPFLQYKWFIKKAKIYSKELRVQRTIFQNKCHNLLKEVIDYDAASSRLNMLLQDMWLDS